MKPHLVLCEELVNEPPPRGQPSKTRYVTVLVAEFDTDIEAVTCMQEKIERYPLNVYYTAKVSRKMQMKPTCVPVTSLGETE